MKRNNGRVIIKYFSWYIKEKVGTAIKYRIKIMSPDKTIMYSIRMAELFLFLFSLNNLKEENKKIDKKTTLINHLKYLLTGTVFNPKIKSCGVLRI
ncbi:MAG: hypothetical protein ABIR50_06045 [Ginsengibacter sp.]